MTSIIASLSEGKKWDKSSVLKILHEIRDPGVPMTLFDMGILEEKWVYIDGSKLRVEFRPSSPMCPVALALGVVIKHVLQDRFGSDVKVRMVRGSHFQESLVNDLLEDEMRFRKAVERLRSSGFVRRCFRQM